MNKIRKGDDVVVTTGKDKGKRGVVLSCLDAERLLELLAVDVEHDAVGSERNPARTAAAAATTWPTLAAARTTLSTRSRATRATRLARGGCRVRATCHRC